MPKRLINILLFGTITGGILCLFASCGKKGTETGPDSLKPEISRVIPSAVQTGDTLLLSGKNLYRDKLAALVYLSGRPVKIISQVDTAIRILVPEKTQTGPVIVHIGQQTAVGPQVTLLGTPELLNANPLYVYAGDTITLTGRALSDDKKNCRIWLDDKPAEIVSVKNDTAILVIPAGTGIKAALSWQTYNGPVYRTAPFRISVRPAAIVADNILDYLAKDPWMDLIGEIINYYVNHTPDGDISNDILKKYVTGQLPCTMFLPNNKMLNSMGIYSQDDKDKIQELYSKLFNSTHPGLLTESMLVPVLYPTLYTNAIYNPWGGDPNLSTYLSFIIDGDKRYVTATSNSGPDLPVYPNGTPALILGMHKAGNGMVGETTDFLKYPYIW